MKYIDVDAICDEPRVFIETLDNVNNKVLFDFLSQLRIRFWDVGGVLTIFLSVNKTPLHPLKSEITWHISTIVNVETLLKYVFEP